MTNTTHPTTEELLPHDWKNRGVLLKEEVQPLLDRIEQLERESEEWQSEASFYGKQASEWEDDYRELDEKLGTERFETSAMLAGQKEQIATLTAQVSQLRKDAEKWRALMACERIRIMGRTLDYKHIGIEFWTKHRAAHPNDEFPQDECREHLEEFVRRARTEGGGG